MDGETIDAVLHWLIDKVTVEIVYLEPQFRARRRRWGFVLGVPNYLLRTMRPFKNGRIPQSPVRAGNIAKSLKCNEKTVRRALDKLHANGAISKRRTFRGFQVAIPDSIKWKGTQREFTENEDGWLMPTKPWD